jgi:ankyrin repeat protein
VLEGLLQTGAEIDALDYVQRTPLMYACANNRLDAAALLIKHGASVELTDKYSLSPLHLACDTGESETELIEFLLDADAPINALCRVR